MVLARTAQLENKKHGSAWKRTMNLQRVYAVTTYVHRALVGTRTRAITLTVVPMILPALLMMRVACVRTLQTLSQVDGRFFFELQQPDRVSQHMVTA